MEVLDVPINEVGDSWPEGISDGLTLACSVCGEIPRFDYRVTDDAWETTIPKDFRRGVICLPCFDLLASEAGIHTSDVLEEVQFIGLTETLVLNPGTAYRYGQRSAADEAPSLQGASQ